MPNEAKFYVVVPLAVEMVAAGFAVILTERKMLAWVMLILGTLVLAGVFLLWPEDQTAKSSAGEINAGTINGGTNIGQQNNYYTPLPVSPNATPTSLQGPEFSLEQQPDDVTLWFGTNVFSTAKANLVSPREVVGPNGEWISDMGPIFLKVQNNGLYVSAKGVGPHGEMTIEWNKIKQPVGNQYYDADVNFDQHALELSVQAKGQPRWQPQFQMIVKSNTEIDIYGYFLNKKGRLSAITKDNDVENPDPSHIPVLVPLFKHPYSAFPHQLIGSK